MAEPAGEELRTVTHLPARLSADSDTSAESDTKTPLTCEDIDDAEKFIRLMIQLALAGERVSGASEEGGIVTAADEAADPYHVPLPPEVLADSTIPEWAPPLPAHAPTIPMQKAPVAEEPRGPVREPRGDDWWTRRADSGSPWPSPVSLASPEEDEPAGHEREPGSSGQGDEAREHPPHEDAGPTVSPDPVVKEPDGDDVRGHVARQVRDAFAPVAAELRDLRARFERPFEPSDDAAENAKRLRWMRIRRYGIPLGVALCPIPPMTPVIGPVLGSYSLASMYASIPQSLQADSGWSLGWAAVAAVVPTTLVVVRFAAHLKARRKPGFTLRVATSAMVCGSVMYGPVGAYAIFLMNGHIA